MPKETAADFLEDAQRNLELLEASLPKKVDEYALSSKRKLPFKTLWFRDSLCWRMAQLSRARAKLISGATVNREIALLRHMMAVAKTSFCLRQKNGDTRRVPLDSIARHELAQHRARVKDDDLVFPSFDNDGNVVALSDVKTAFGRALKDAKITDFRFHDLRHTFASRYVMKEGSLYKLSKILGHRDIKMTHRYAKLSPDFIQAEKERLDSIWTVDPKNPHEPPSQVSSNLIQ